VTRAAFSWWLRMHTEDHEAAWIREPLERLARGPAPGPLVTAYQASYGKFRRPRRRCP
jgi:hypothetical protein